ncbi:SMEK domain-containing protein [Cupriavidus sp. D39]|uniref:SMEK domain-containing protein n=1 Tax=Cupriavidus sp. D39 TaxID=2997877 RepID=UPI00226EAAA4|nr:SMEK domain-containing protein [Cupriavidus sp. D39]MCY0853394.1 SMEK domain-containing protein [Cupriavidus sp. D39]
MNSNQALADRLAIYLAAYKHYVEIKSKARLLDVAIFGESFARDLAEIVFDYKDLVNLNLETNFPAVDLGSAAAGCAIQVTITSSTTKIVETQRKFFEHRLDCTYSRLKFIILTDKQKTYESQQIIRAHGAFSFDPDQDIYDLGDLFKILVAAADPAKFNAFYRRLEIELGSAIRPYLLGADQPGQHLRDLFDAHDVRTTEAVQALKPFGMTRAIYANNMSIAEVCSRDLIQYVAEQFWVSGEWIDGTYAHIYNGGPGAEKGTDWRRSLRGAYELVKHASSNGERLGLIIPAGLSLRDMEAFEDVVDHNARDYEHFFLIARKTNDFFVDSFRLVISDPLRYRGCRDGIFLLFVAAEIYEIETREKTYINVYEAPRAQLLSCDMGDKFLVDLYRSSQLIRNHKDFVYSEEGVLKATQELPSRLAPLLQANLTEFVDRHSSSLPAAIVFP